MFCLATTAPDSGNGLTRVDVQGMLQVPPEGPPTSLGQQLNLAPESDLLRMLAAIKLGVDNGAAATVSNSASLDGFKAEMKLQIREIRQKAAGMERQVSGCKNSVADLKSGGNIT